MTSNTRKRKAAPKGQGGAKGRRRLGARRRAAAKRRMGAPFAFVAASLACLALALGVALAVGILRPSPRPPAQAAILPAAASPETPGAKPAALRAPSAALPASSPAKNLHPTVARRSSPEQPPRKPAAAVPPVRPPIRPALPRKSLIFVVDDAGYNLKELEAFLRLPFPLTVAVLPRLPYSEQAARAIKAAGKELILHQPMEALGGQNPGPGAIAAGSSPEEAERIVEENLETVPGALGMNNHMGSAVTTDPATMDAVAAIAKKRGIYYLDSLTISGTASQEAALREGIRYWERDVFLDNAPDRASMIRAVEDGKKSADTGRPAVMIGHVWSAELAQTMMDLYPQLVAEGYSLTTISRYMLAEASDDEDPRD